MAALTVTAASVLPGTAAPLSGIIGETVTAGQAVYLKAADSRLWLAQCDGTAAEAAVVGIMLTGGAAGQQGIYAASGSVINIGATTAKVHYFANPTAGGVGLQADILSTQYITRIGYSTATDGTFTIDLKVTGVVF